MTGAQMLKTFLPFTFGCKRNNNRTFNAFKCYLHTWLIFLFMQNTLMRNLESSVSGRRLRNCCSIRGARLLGLDVFYNATSKLICRSFAAIEIFSKLCRTKVARVVKRTRVASAVKGTEFDCEDLCREVMLQYLLHKAFHATNSVIWFQAQ